MKNLKTYKDFLNESSITEDYRNTDPSLKEYVGKKVKAILEEDDGENSYVTIQFNDNTQMKITAYPMGSGGVGLVVESLNEGATPRLLKSAGQNLARQVKGKKNYTVDQLKDRLMSTPLVRMLTDDEILTVLDHAKEELGITESVVNKSRVNEAVEYSVGDFPIGADVTMGDEVWKVVKPGVRGEKIIMAPFNADAKRKYISIAIEFDLNWLNANITNISK